MVISYLFYDRPRAFYYTLAVCMNLYMMSIGKMGYHLPRPYMVKDEIQVFGCSKEFGHPSGHTFSSSAILLTIMWDVLSSESDDRKKFLFKFVTIANILLIGFSRLHNGDHTLD